MGDGRAEGLSLKEDGRQVAISLTPGIDGRHIRILESSQLKGSYIGDLYCISKLKTTQRSIT